jgi:hypothetical protein
MAGQVPCLSMPEAGFLQPLRFELGPLVLGLSWQTLLGKASE